MNSIFILLFPVSFSNQIYIEFYKVYLYFCYYPFFPLSMRIVCNTRVYKTCVHSLSSYLIFIPLHSSMYRFFPTSIRIACIWYKSFSNHSSLHSFVFIIIVVINEHQIIIITNCHEHGHFPFHDGKGTRKKLNIENLCILKKRIRHALITFCTILDA